jgi:hypothetical protein
MRNNLKNIALGVLGLLVLGAFVNSSNNSPGSSEVGRYVPILNNSKDITITILDTKTGRIYFTQFGENVYCDYVKGSKPSE